VYILTMRMSEMTVNVSRDSSLFAIVGSFSIISWKFYEVDVLEPTVFNDCVTR